MVIVIHGKIKMEADELIESDRKILDELQRGRCTPAVLVDWTGLSKQTIHNRLNVLVAAGHVKKVHESGLYELVEDPRDEELREVVCEEE